MQPANFIARLIGPVFIVLGAGILANVDLYSAIVAEAVRMPILIYIAGLLALTAGIAMLNAYRAWTSDWRVVITALGWLLVIGGIARIVLPHVTAAVAAMIYSKPAVIAFIGSIVLVFGGFLSFKGYCRTTEEIDRCLGEFARRPVKR